MNTKKEIEKNERKVARLNRKLRLSYIISIAALISIVIIAVISFIIHSHAYVYIHFILVVIVGLNMYLQNNCNKKIRTTMKPYYDKFKDQLPAEFGIS